MTSKSQDSFSSDNLLASPLTQVSLTIEPSPTWPTTPVLDSHNHSTSFSGSDQGDEYTLTAFGDISLSNIYFIPGLPSDISPTRDDSPVKIKPIRSPPVSKVPMLLADHTLPSVIQNILPPSLPTAAISPGAEFGQLVKQLRQDCKFNELTSDHHCTGSVSLGVIHSPQPYQVTNSRMAAELEAEMISNRSCRATVVRAPVVPPPAALTGVLKRKERPLRGNAKLPRRPPLPRWDLHEPTDVQVEQPQNTPGKLTRRT